MVLSLGYSFNPDEAVMHAMDMQIRLSLSPEVIQWLTTVIEIAGSSDPYSGELIHQQLLDAGLDLTIEEIADLENLQSFPLLQGDAEKPNDIYIASYQTPLLTIARLLHMMVKRFEVKPIGLTYSSKKARGFNSHGGGAILITRQGIEHIDAQEWLAERLAA